MRHITIVAAALIAVSGLAVPAVAQDDEGGSCDPDAVTVVVDAEMLDGDLDVLCVDSSDGATVLDAVTSAGFDVEGTTEFGSSIVCRVDGAPDQSREPCDAMPSADAYWISWVGTDEGWTYAQAAVDTQEVGSGDVVALSFQEGTDERQPPLSPDEAVANAEPVDEAAEADTDEGGTPWVGIVLGALVVALLGLLLLWVARRRARDT